VGQGYGPGGCERPNRFDDETPRELDLRVELAPGLPPIHADPEQLKRVIGNRVDNAAEAMRDVPVKLMLVRTAPSSADSIELLVADTGCGISPEDIPTFILRVRNPDRFLQ